MLGSLNRKKVNRVNKIRPTYECVDPTCFQTAQNVPDCTFSMLYKQMQSILPMSEFDSKKETNHEFLIRLHAHSNKVSKKVEAVEYRNQVTVS